MVFASPNANNDHNYDSNYDDHDQDYKDNDDDDDDGGKYIDDEIWCLLVPAFRTGDKANVPTYLPHCFPGSNTVEHF